jgi:hypothetical protein
MLNMSAQIDSNPMQWCLAPSQSASKKFRATFVDNDPDNYPPLSKMRECVPGATAMLNKKGDIILDFPSEQLRDKYIRNPILWKGEPRKLRVVLPTDLNHDPNCVLATWNPGFVLEEVIEELEQHVSKIDDQATIKKIGKNKAAIVLRTAENKKLLLQNKIVELKEGLMVELRRPQSDSPYRILLKGQASDCDEEEIFEMIEELVPEAKDRIAEVIFWRFKDTNKRMNIMEIRFIELDAANSCLKFFCKGYRFKGLFLKSEVPVNSRVVMPTDNSVVRTAKQLPPSTTAPSTSIWQEKAAERTRKKKETNEIHQPSSADLLQVLQEFTKRLIESEDLTNLKEQLKREREELKEEKIELKKILEQSQVMNENLLAEIKQMREAQEASNKEILKLKRENKKLETQIKLTQHNKEEGEEEVEEIASSSEDEEIVIKARSKSTSAPNANTKQTSIRDHTVKI